MTGGGATTPSEDPASWEDRAACKGMDTELFFPEDAGWVGVEQADKAKAVCDGCPVKKECLDLAMRDRRLMGIWGGTTTEERRAERRRRHRHRQSAPERPARRHDQRDDEGGRS